jgi:hypothetical protein
MVYQFHYQNILLNNLLAMSQSWSIIIVDGENLLLNTCPVYIHTSAPLLLLRAWSIGTSSRCKQRQQMVHARCDIQSLARTSEIAERVMYDECNFEGHEVSYDVTA